MCVFVCAGALLRFLLRAPFYAGALLRLLLLLTLRPPLLLQCPWRARHNLLRPLARHNLLR